MGWKGVTIMDQRVRFISNFLDGYFSFSDLCDQFSISRKTGYKWVSRYEAFGPNGLIDQSRHPRHCPHKTPEDVAADLIRARQKHPSWGPKKLLDLLKRRDSRREYPAISTAADIIKRAGLISPAKRRFRRKHPGCPRTITTAPNQVWTADYKGQFLMQNGQYCYPLTVCDMHSRFLLGCDGHDAVSMDKSKQAFTRLFVEFGLPDRIRTDNGIPFASNAVGRLSSLSVWWIKLGIYPELIEPGKPQQNGKHERMHRTLKKEATIPAERDLARQQVRFEHFRKEYNSLRPHEALGMKRPAEVYMPSTRRMPRKLTHYDYPGHFEVRLVSNNNGIHWNHRWVSVSSTLRKEYIGFEEIAEGIHDVYFCDLLIGRFFEEIGKITDVIERVPLRPRLTR